MSDIPRIEITQAIVTRDHQPVGIFVVQSDALSPQQYEIVQATWVRLWEGQAFVPALLHLPSHWKLTALNDVELRKVGLMRISAD